MLNSSQQQTATLTSKLLKNWPASGKKQSEQQSIVVSKKQPELSPSIAKLAKPKQTQSKARTAAKVAHPEIDGYKVFELTQMEYPFDQLNKEGDFLVVKENEQHPKFYAGVIISKEEMNSEHLKGALNLSSSLVPVSGLLFRAFIRKGRVVVPRENVPTSVNIALTGFEIR